MGGSIASLLPDFQDVYTIYFHKDGTPWRIVKDGRIVGVYIGDKLYKLPITKLFL